MITARRLVRGALWRAGRTCLSLAENISLPNGHVHLDILEREGEWIVCRINGFVWRLDSSQFIDRMLLNDGVFEPESIKWVESIVKPGMVVADVGANFGYYTVQLSHLVGPSGKVYAFEPSARYRERLNDHLARNKCGNVVIADYGLSDRSGEQTLFGDEVSATLEWADDAKSPVIEETVRLRTLDDYVDEAGLSRLDFVKVDIDGHEPRFIAGAVQTLRRFHPVILMEFANISLWAAGSNSESLGNQLTDLGYILCSEKTGEPYQSHADFLREAMNCSHSVNVLCRPKAALA